mmetsp:Transcript_17980/g.22008  ORF Transcript_17980/g.22008 Transcript_17980/m.22008 type:complete len:301 (-) Transcript_17980:260-1162(-)
MIKFPSFVLLAVFTSTQAFTGPVAISPLRTFGSTSISTSTYSISSSPITIVRPIARSFILYSETPESSSEADASSEEATVEDESAAEEQDQDQEQLEEEEDEEPKEDPEITAIKSEIAKLESQLKQKNRELNDRERMADEYTKSGYARKVAELESFRRSRSIASNDNKMAARATILQEFLPILSKLQQINKEYEGDDFAKTYSALSWDFNNSLKDLGMTEYTVKEGDKVDIGRVTAVQEEYSDTIAKGCVIQPVEIGYELDGNVMKFASAVVSLGSEAELVSADAETETDSQTESTAEEE